MQFIHPYAESLGITRHVIKTGSAAVSMMTTDQHTNILGYVHGGLLYSLADIAFELASNSHPPDAVGIHTQMNFFKGVKAGAMLTAIATETHLGRKLATYQVEIRNEDELIASFTGTVYRMPKK